MIRGSTRARSAAVRLIGLVVCGMAALGCEPGAPLARAGVDITIPQGWREAAATTWPVPGVPLAAWSGPDRSSLVIYRTLPIPDGTAQQVAQSLGVRLRNLPGVSVEKAECETWGGREAARVEAVGPGTGDAFASSGAGVPVTPKSRALEPTRRVIIGFVRPSDTLFLVWHGPDVFRSALASDVMITLDRLQLVERSAASSSY